MPLGEYHKANPVKKEDILVSQHKPVTDHLVSVTLQKIEKSWTNESEKI